MNEITEKYIEKFSKQPYLIDLVDDCPYIEPYIEFDVRVRHLIESGVNSKGEKIPEKEIKRMKRTIGYTKYNSIEIDKDIVAILREYFGFFYFNSVYNSSLKPIFDEFDFFDPEQTKLLLKFKSSKVVKFDNNLACLLYDLEQLLSQIDFTFKEQEVLELYRREDWTQQMIAKELKVSQQYVSQIIDKIVYKINEKYYDIYEDWYYLNIVKGKYKKCSKCGEIKLANERHFNKNKRGKYGLNSICKECRKK